MAFRNYLEGEDDKPYFHLNSLAHYYEKMEGFAALVENAAKTLNLTKEEIEQRVTTYILENKTQLDQRLGEWDEKLQQFDGSVTDLLAEWVDDGTLNHIIDTTLIDQKIAPLAGRLAETVKRDDTGVLDLNVFDEPTRAAIQGIEPGTINAVLGEGNVTPENTNFLVKKSPNLIDKTKSTAGKNINYFSGGLNDQATYSTTDFIPVKAGKTYAQKTMNMPKAFYTINKVFISGLATGTQAVAPANAAFIRTSYLTANNGEMLVEGSVLPDTYNEYSTDFIPSNKLFIPYNQIELRGSIESADIKQKAVSPTKTNFMIMEGVNLFNTATVTADKSVSYFNGNLADDVGYSVSDFIPIEEGIYTTDTNGYKAVYDANKVFLVGSATTQITAPAAGKFLRYSVKTNELNKAMVVKGNVLLPYETFSDKYTMDKTVVKLDKIIKEVVNPMIGTKKWSGKKSIHLGDSITTTGYSTQTYYNLLKTELELGFVTSYGISSSTISNGLNSYQPMVDRFAAMSDDADILTVFGGTNDWGNSQAPKGTFYNTDGTVNKDTTTFYGACHFLFEGLVKKYAVRNTLIIIMTPLQRVGQNTPNAYSGMKLSDYAAVIKEVAKFYALPILDLYEISGMNPNIAEIKTNFFVDNVHPNNLGQTKIGQRLGGFINTLV